MAWCMRGWGDRCSSAFSSDFSLGPLAVSPLSLTADNQKLSLDQPTLNSKFGEPTAYFQESLDSSLEACDSTRAVTILAKGLFVLFCTTGCALTDANGQQGTPRISSTIRCTVGRCAQCDNIRSKPQAVSWAPGCALIGGHSASC
jgi:hypothetical protein